MDSKRQVEARDSTRPLQPQRHKDTEENHEPLVFSVPPCLCGSSGLKVADGDRNGTAAPALADPAKTICRRDRKEHEDQTSRCSAALCRSLRSLCSLRLVPGLRILRSQLPRWESSVLKRDQSLNTPAPATCGSRQEKPSVKIFHRIVYGKVPAVRLRTWPHPAADDDHPASKDELPLRRRKRQEELAASAPGRPRRAVMVVEGATGKAREP